MNINIALAAFNGIMLAANLIAGGQGALYVSAIAITAFAAGWCLAFGIAQVWRRRYG